jgi:hypothetical protein
MGASLYASIVATALTADLLGAVASVVGALGAGLATAQVLRIARVRADGRGEPSFADRVADAVKALRNASEIVGDLEQEIEARRKAVEHLQEQQEILEIEPEKLEAISHLLQGDAKTETRRATWISVGASAFFFLAGIAVTLLVS